MSPLSFTDVAVMLKFILRQVERVKQPGVRKLSVSFFFGNAAVNKHKHKPNDVRCVKLRNCVRSQTFHRGEVGFRCDVWRHSGHIVSKSAFILNFSVFPIFFKYLTVKFMECDPTSTRYY